MNPGVSPGWSRVAPGMGSGVFTGGSMSKGGSRCGSKGGSRHSSKGGPGATPSGIRVRLPFFTRYTQQCKAQNNGYILDRGRKGPPPGSAPPREKCCQEALL